MKGKKTGGGSRKGIPNKATASIKEMIEGALSEAGGKDYLVQQARDNPAAFMSLVAKILPRDVNHGGQPGNPIEIAARITEVVLRPLDKTDAS